MKLLIRPFMPLTDTGFILSTYPKSVYYKLPKENRPASKKAWMGEFYQGLLELLGTADIRILCTREEPNFIIGYAISHGSKLLFMYVKKDYRGQGLSKLLIKGTKLCPY
jgi:GNAT superfamily N-acetyltransferase